MKVKIDKAIEFIEKEVGVSPLNFSIKKKTQPYRIRWKGQIVKLRNGKTVWPSLGAAKNALINKIDKNKFAIACLEGIPDEHYSFYCNTPYIKYAYRHGYYQMIIEQLQELNILKFEPVERDE